MVRPFCASENKEYPSLSCSKVIFSGVTASIEFLKVFPSEILENLLDSFCVCFEFGRYSFLTTSKKDEKIVKKRVLLCKANPRKLKTGEKVLTTEIPVYGVWYE